MGGLQSETRMRRPVRASPVTAKNCTASCFVFVLFCFVLFCFVCSIVSVTPTYHVFHSQLIMDAAEGVLLFYARNSFLSITPILRIKGTCDLRQHGNANLRCAHGISEGELGGQLQYQPEYAMTPNMSRSGRGSFHCTHVNPFEVATVAAEAMKERNAKPG